MKLSAYDPADSTVSISPDGLRFKWIENQPYRIGPAGQLEAVYPPFQLESGYSDSYLWDQAQASIAENFAEWNFLPYEGGGWITPIVPTFDTGDGGPSHGGALMPANYALPLFDSGVPLTVNYGVPVANFAGGGMYSPEEIRWFAIEQGWVKSDGALVSEAAAFQIYAAAKVYGVTAAQIDLAMGWPAGTAQQWIVANGQQALTGVPMNMATPAPPPAPVYVAPPPAPATVAPPPQSVAYPSPAPAPSPSAPPPVLILPAGNPTPEAAPAPMGGTAMILAALAALSLLS